MCPESPAPDLLLQLLVGDTGQRAVYLQPPEVGLLPGLQVLRLRRGTPVVNFKWLPVQVKISDLAVEISPGGKGKDIVMEDPWAAGAQKPVATAIPAHLRKELQDLLQTQGFPVSEHDNLVAALASAFADPLVLLPCMRQRAATTIQETHDNHIDMGRLASSTEHNYVAFNSALMVDGTGSVSLVDRPAFETEHSAMQLQVQRLLYHGVFHKPVLRRLQARFPLLPAGRGHPTDGAEGQGAIPSVPTGTFATATPDALQPPAGAASHDSMKYLYERAEDWAERWAPSVFFGNNIDNHKDWMDWCVSHVTAVLQRPQFDAHFNLDDAFGSDTARRGRAVEICTRAWQRSDRPRSRRPEVHNAERQTTIVQRELAEEAAEHRACRRWVERETRGNPRPAPAGDHATSTTSTTTSTSWRQVDILATGDASSRDGLSGRTFVPTSIATEWRVLKNHLANSPRGQLSSDFLSRIGVASPATEDNNPRHVIARLAVAYRTYNILRTKHEEQDIVSIRPLCNLGSTAAATQYLHTTGLESQALHTDAAASAWCLCCVPAGAGYARPPCGPNETYAKLFGTRVLCTSPCGRKGRCSPDKPDGTFAEPKCVLEVDPGQEGAKQGQPNKPTYCGLVCTSNSYCPKGSRCTKGKEDSMVAKGLDDSLGLGLSADDFKGVCSFKEKANKTRAPPEPPLQLRLSAILAKGVTDFKDKLGIPADFELPTSVDNKKSLEL
ncbi:unnamed protein product [Prorocentrum cordatum]|uniref:Uncharacterized protein n=1 Tax=Prorocentrum cordatum TaxID=2364126 RepID=A0ABN9TWG0_9DINO|nr:unnamed protein product [Polarella glacialis]